MYFDGRISWTCNVNVMDMQRLSTIIIDLSPTLLNLKGGTRRQVLIER